MPTKRIKHSQSTRRMVTYLYHFCRRDHKGCKGFLTAREIEKITGVPQSSVFKIARGYF